MVLQHILANFRQPGSYSLALQWLYSLFVAYSQADISAQHEAAASAHANAPQVSPIAFESALRKSRGYTRRRCPRAYLLTCSQQNCLWDEKLGILAMLRVFSCAAAGSAGIGFG